MVCAVCFVIRFPSFNWLLFIAVWKCRDDGVCYLMKRDHDKICFFIFCVVVHKCGVRGGDSGGF